MFRLLGLSDIGEQFSSQVTCQVTLQHDPHFRICIEVTLQCFNLPALASHRPDRNHIYVRGVTVEQKGRTQEVSRNEVTKNSLASRQAH